MCASGAAPPPATQPADQGKLKFLQIDVKNKRIHMECEAVNPEERLEFLVCVNGTKEYESLLRSRAKPSHLHLALLMLGLEPGEPAHFSEKENRWLAPRGPALHLTCEWESGGKTISLPVHALLRNVKSKQPMPPTEWVFVGSRVQEGDYAADVMGYLVTLVNFEFTVVDVPQLKSSHNEELEWEVNPDVAPKRGTKVDLIFAAGKKP